MGFVGGQPEQGTMKAFKVDFSKEDLADVFATCVFCLNHAVDRATSSEEALQLSVIRLRLTRWGEAVKIYEKPVLEYYEPDADNLHETREALVDIITLFDTGNLVENKIVSHPKDRDLQETLQAIALERSLGGNGLLAPPYLGIRGWSEVQYKRASWSISRLEGLFGAEHLRNLCAEERQRINNKSALDHLGAVAKRLDLDPWLARSVLNNHNFSGDMFVHMGSGYQYNNTGSGLRISSSGPNLFNYHGESKS